MQSSNDTRVFTKPAIQALCALLLFVSMSAQSTPPAPSDHFVTTWKTDNPGASNESSITVPMIGGPYEVDWDNDEVFDEVIDDGSASHDFGVPGTYTIRIRPFNFDTIKMLESGDEEKLISVDQWGIHFWTSMNSAFAGTTNLTVNATDTPNFVVGMDLSHMFGSSGANPDVRYWDTSKVVNLTGMFASNTAANPDLTIWDTSLVESTDNMFNGATSANPDVSGWNVTSLASAAGMFTNSGFSSSNYERLLLNWGAQTLIWNVPFNAGSATVCTNSAKLAKLDLVSISYFWNVLDGGEFCNPADEFVTTWKTDNPGVSNDSSIKLRIDRGSYEVDWDGSGAYEEVNTLFKTHDFGTPGTYTIRIRSADSILFQVGEDEKKLVSLDQWGTIAFGSFYYSFLRASNMIVNATDVPNMSAAISTVGMFIDASSANPDTSEWNIRSIEDMSSMFDGATSANPDTSSWDTSSVTRMSGMFSGATSANPDTSNWDTSSVIHMGWMFRDATTANPDTTNWDTSKVVYMTDMFNGATSANPDISNWNTAAVEIMKNMFAGAVSFDQDVSGWDISSLTQANGMFTGVRLSTENYENLLVFWSLQSPNSGVVFDAGKSTYCSPASVAAKNSLVNTYNWVISDLGECFVENFFSDGFE